MYPILFQIGAFKMHAWGLFLLIGFLLTVVRAAKVAPKYGVDPSALWDSSLIGLFGGVLGGRLAFVAQEWSQFSANPGEILKIWTGGMTSVGGIVGGLVAGLIAAKKRGLNVGAVADLAGVSFPIGYFFGRLGCFFNGCCYGTHCDAPWAISFKDEAGGFHDHVHPTQLYAVLASAIMYAILTFLEKRPRIRFQGELLLAFAALYGIYRFVVEFWRAQDGPQSIKAGLSTGQWASVAIFALALVAFFLIPKQKSVTS